MKKLLSIILCLCIQFAKAQLSPSSENILYVNASVSGGTGTGNSWVNAIPQLADALKYARTQYDANNTVYDLTPLKIFVAKGTYKPLYNAADGLYTATGNAATDYTDRDNAFVMVKNVQIYGGFDPNAGVSDLTGTRDYTNTILSGDIGTVGTKTDNTYHVVISANNVGSALIDGFTITEAYSTSLNTGNVTVNEISVGRKYTGGGMHNRASSPSISNCSFMGNTAHYGAAIGNLSSSSPVIADCKFTENTATYAGGSMYNANSTPTISNCSFTENKATEYGGGIYNDVSSPVINSCSFTKNASWFGGGMFNRSSSPTIINSIFKENRASFEAGGMHNNVSPSTIINSVFTGNTANKGGAIYSNSSSPSITNTTISNNGSDGFYISGGTSNLLLQNTILWDMLTVNSGSYTANHSLIKDVNPPGMSNINALNLTADDVFADYSGGDYTLKSSSTAINAGNNSYNSTTSDFSGNVRIFNGTIDLGAYEYQNIASYTISTTANPTTDGNVLGAGNYNSGTTASLTATSNTGYAFVSWTENGTVVSTAANYSFTVTANRTLVANFSVNASPDINSILYVNVNVSGGNGTGSSWANAIPQLADALKYARMQYDADNTIYDANPLKIYVAKGSYKPFYNAADQLYATTGAATTGYTDRDNAFVMVKNVQLYGGFDPDNNISDLSHTRNYTNTILSGDIGTVGTNTDNAYHVVISAGPVAGALLNGFTITAGYATSLTAVKIIVNGISIFGARLGGGMYNGSSSPVIANCTFTGNSASFGAGMQNYSLSSPTITNCSFTNNLATGTGGGISNSLSSSPTITNCIFTDNSANSGGGIYNASSSSPAVTNSLFSENTASTEGGGIDNAQSSPIINYCIFTKNTAPVGAGIYNSNSSPVITNCSFTGNTGSDGSGMYNASSSPSITDCSFTENTASSDGGGMSNSSSSPIINNCNFTRNTAANTGGGMSNAGSSPTIKNSIFAENTVSNVGGAMYNAGSSPIISNSIFKGNTASNDGGAMYNRSPSSPTIANSTIANNGSNGFYVTGSTTNAILQNTILWETVTTANSGSYTANYSLLKGINPPGTGNINATSLAATSIFTDFSGGDYTLKSSSPAVNAGNNSYNTSTTDLVGNPRLVDNQIDMGAYENQTITILPVNFGKFTAIPQSNRVKLDWNTFSETNNNSFIIYRSTDGVNYTEITQQASKGSNANSYTTFDNNPANGVNYYRLSQKDSDGTITKLADDVVNFSLANAEVKAWPNPVAKTLFVSFAAGKYQSLRLVDVTGKKLLERNIASAQNETEIEMSTYSKGIYIVELKGSNGSHLVKVIK